MSMSNKMVSAATKNIAANPQGPGETVFGSPPNPGGPTGVGLGAEASQTTMCCNAADGIELLAIANNLETLRLTEPALSNPESPPARDAVDLAARYGRTPAAARRTRWAIAASALAFTVILVAWLVWGGLLQAPAQLEARDIGHRILDDSAVSVTWELNVEPHTKARCALQALNSSFGIVGWVIVDVPASAERTRQFTETVRTTEPAVTGLIYRCWLT